MVGGGYPPPPFLEYGTIFKFSWWNKLRTAKNCKQKQSFFLLWLIKPYMKTWLYKETIFVINSLIL